ncbi:FKBP-type peptidyl-prolyl cis-trans isomerase [Microbacterium sp. ARD32]|uniref:FKBP-type peptidyl-prolyl cis-trans isomerase n=1 Tax=Microbacterium sp. ARD32 TaxID=2962577 RepID=UPI00288266B1|nr:FKBP-type peptidyl-prolyl cis-trans isomerase [Microbacterium sp. ARD32]MDT0156886.1 FKBP-type peptidyl-prolyl cis-trans isomerase [Microbacterium sp. ARD32]
MRLRPVALLATLTLSSLLLAGCAGTPEGKASPEPTSSSECLVDAKPGAGSDAIKVTGEGVDAKVEVPKGTKFEGVERTILKKGSGDDVHAGDLIAIRYQVIEADTNKVVETSERGVDGVLPMLLDPSNAQNPQIVDSTQSPVFIAAAECAPVGSDIVLALPGQDDQGAVVVYMQTLEELPTTASGKAVDAPADMATVKLAKDGEPAISIPGGEKPTETVVGLLKQGDGPKVAAGDLVTVQYMGVKWSDGTSFDSSWSRDAMPTQFQTTGVVAGFRKALEGQQVGSQVLVEIPPADGYGAVDGNELQKETLVFVVDILGTTPLLAASAE